MTSEWDCVPGSCAKSSGKCLGHIHDKLEWNGSSDDPIHDGQDNESMYE